MAERSKIEITQTGSAIRRDRRQRETLHALGLGRIGRKAVHSNDPSVIGMVRKVAHLVSVREHKG